MDAAKSGGQQADQTAGAGFTEQRDSISAPEETALERGFS
jgi:hypothetical protein